MKLIIKNLLKIVLLHLILIYYHLMNQFMETEYVNYTISTPIVDININTYVHTMLLKISIAIKQKMDLIKLHVYLS